MAAKKRKSQAEKVASAAKSKQAEMKKKETAKKKGTEVFTGHEYLKDFCTAMHYTEVRKQIALRNEEYFRNMMDFLL